MNLELSNELNCPVCTCKNVVRNFSGESYLRFRDYQRLFTCKLCLHSWRTPLLSNHLAMTDRYELQSGLVRYSTYTANFEEDVPQYLKERASIFKQNSTVLDFGSGDGTFLQYLRSKDIDAWGVDQNLDALKSESLRTFVKNDVSEFTEEQFDYIHANHVMEHVSNPIYVLKALRKYIKPSGLILIEVPNELESLTTLLKKLLGKKSISATSLYEHQHFFSPTSLRYALISAGFVPNHVCTPWRIKKGLRGVFDLTATAINKGNIIYATASVSDKSDSNLNDTI